jgi:hypothetical protein
MKSTYKALFHDTCSEWVTFDTERIIAADTLKEAVAYCDEITKDKHMHFVSLIKMNGQFVYL